MKILSSCTRFFFKKSGISEILQLEILFSGLILFKKFKVPFQARIFCSFNG